MAVTYSTAAKTARMQAVIDTIDGGAGSPANGALIIRDGSNNELAVIELTSPCGTAASGVLTFDFDPDLVATATGTGTATNAIITDSADATVISGLTVGLSSESPTPDVILDNTSITAGQTVTFTVGTITHA